MFPTGITKVKITHSTTNYIKKKKQKKQKTKNTIDSRSFKINIQSLSCEAFEP